MNKAPIPATVFSRELLEKMYKQIEEGKQKRDKSNKGA